MLAYRTVERTEVSTEGWIDAIRKVLQALTREHGDLQSATITRLTWTVDAEGPAAYTVVARALVPVAVPEPRELVGAR
ncbi:MAG: hypothetical protein HY685_06680 [Chloroflexi bacterium]|nr:hypothetical protein [Chloroflexota bacterium]